MITITGLGPGDLARIPGPVLELLLDRGRTLIVRTAQHPAAEQISKQRDVIFCDDIYESQTTFEAVYAAIADRVLAAGADGDVVYAVPGGPSVGEFAVREILARAEDVEVMPAETFVDAILAETGYDPFDRGIQILNGHDLPTPLVIDKPTIVGHLDRPEILADVTANLSRVVPDDAELTVFIGLGASDQRVWEGKADDVSPDFAGYRTSIWVDTPPGGLVGAVQTMLRLREECPWDAEQTHESLIKYLVEETFELADAVSELGTDSTDHVAYARVEDELGDVLLQTLFHAAIAAQGGAFDIDDVGEVLRQKLVRRHPHVFGDVEVADAAEVKRNWDQIKQGEKQSEDGSAFAGVSAGMPALHRAAKVQNRASKFGLDEGRASREEIAVALESLGSNAPIDDRTVGNLLFHLVAVARESGIDADMALRSAVNQYEQRLRELETS